ncbi:MAG: homoserine O-succinyltransferase [Lachnospiraceae bacterium]|uniref:Homoserine O-acetyltransferase n=1 Tax=Candidatus Weimeria bifida TaxID=2599074 RepID=A0A6N7IZ43_9FIRM|nr:homoserine O-succinyltransferase [Candidatus Weimeria bifida]RRF97044.1 MAG: homoserine O-succinyltransferase [Lachnospiraceae bacterium]
MPIRTQANMPVNDILEKENIFLMDENRAMHQDIRPIEIGILNLMPLKEDTELALLRSLSNTPLQIDVTFLCTKSHMATHTSMSHLNKFYETYDDIKEKTLDGLIVTGAPVELLPFEDVDYWDELTKIFDWAKENVTSTLFLCWGAQAALYYYYGIRKITLPKKLFGVYPHRVSHRKVPLVRGFDDIFWAPHSRNTRADDDAIRKDDRFIILAESREAGIFLAMTKDGSEIYVMGHPEYDRMTLDKEYKRDKAKGIKIDLPVNYYPNNDVNQKPLLQWRGHANTLYTNWLNYYVYQNTPYEMNHIKKNLR